MRPVDLDDYDSLGKLKAWLEPWFRDRRGGTGRIDSTENVGDLFGVHSGNIAATAEPKGYILTSLGDRGSEWAANTIGAAFQAMALSEPTLFAYWPNEIASGSSPDLGPHSITLAPVGSGLVYGVDGPFPPATAVSFENTAAFEALADSLNIFGTTNPFTIEALAYLPALADANDPVFSAYTGTTQISLYFSSVGGPNAVYFQRAGTESGFASISTARWVHLAATYDGTNMRLYVDGTLVDTDATSSNLGTLGGMTFRIGRHGTSGPTLSQAHVAPVVLYTSALSAATVKAHAAHFALGGQGGAINLDHGALYGLGDDDHPQYVLKTTTLTAGDGLAGGGDLSANRSFAVNTDGSTIETSADALRVKDGGITEAKVTLADVTTLDVSTAKHGLVPKALGGTAKFLREDGTWNTPASLPSGSAVVATDAIWDAKGDLAGGTGADAASRLAVGANGKILVAASGETTGLKWKPGYLGGLELVYRYTVTGTDKASIDTGSDTADAGTNDWTNGDLLEVHVLVRTDDAGATSGYDLTVNNDTSSIYDRMLADATNATLSAAPALAQAKWSFNAHGSGGTSGYATATKITIPGYAGTVFNKNGTALVGRVDATAGNNAVDMYGLGYRSTSAITRLKVAAQSTAKLKVGVMLLIYKACSS